MTLTLDREATKQCAVCPSFFHPRSTMAKVCSPSCALKLVRRVKRETASALKAARAVDKAKRESLRPLSHWARLAQAEVNRYVRIRDRHLGCVSCDRPAFWDGQWHASHFRSVGAAPGLRFHLWNIHKADSICNNHKSGNLAEYEPRLRARIGDEKVDWLRSQNAPRKFTREYLQRLTSVFRRKANRLEARQ